MQPRAKITLIILSWLWFFLLISGLNSAMEFIGPGLLLYALIFFVAVDLVFPRVGVIFKVLVSLVLVHRTYYIGSFFSLRWLGWLMNDLGADLAALARVGTVQPVTAMVISLLAVIVAQRLYYSLISQGRAVMLLLFTGTALLTGALLWTGKGSAWSVVLYAIIGLVVMGTSRVQMSFSFPMQRWLGMLMVWVLIITSVAWALPNGNINLSQWWERALSWDIYNPDGPVNSRVGYGNYDGNLGGPLELDETPVLMIDSPVPIYLKGETRHNYTGRGWEANFKVGSAGLEFPSHMDGEEITITVEVLAEPGTTVFVPRYPLSVEFETDNEVSISLSAGGVEDSAFRYENYIFSSSTQEVGETYTITALLPVDSPDALRQLTNYGEGGGRYLQLDPDIPQRVLDLAQSVTAEADTGYDMARALVRYLRRGSWQYSLETAIPPQNQDFVDWFLFETDRGYCVHFSTAFVVLARAAGLPARWVKGYSQGVRDESGNFIIQNQHAHAWAEVWFDGYGWVPFEPTPGAVLPTVGQGSDTPPGPDPHDPDMVDEPELPDPGIEQPQDPGTPGQEDSGGLTMATVILLAAALLGAGLALLFLTRNNSVAAVYARLQNRLRLFGWHRQSWETAREHMNRVKELPDQPVLADFIQHFEKSVYGGVEETERMPASQRRKLAKSYSLFKLVLYRFSTRR